MTAVRRYDIDWLRVIAIALLLIYHIAIVFQPWAMFIGFIKSDVAWEGLWKPMTMLNVWRIPLLFYVSGMGVYFAMKKRSWKTLILERSKRILLPFLFGFIAITPLHMFVFQKYYGMNLSYLPDSGHLWFLGNIFAYVILLSPLFFYLKKNNDGRFLNAIRKLMSYALGPLSISIFMVLEVLLLKPQMYELYAKTWHGSFIGLLAFFFGFLLMNCEKTFWTTVSKWVFLYLGIGIILFTLRYTHFLSISSNYLTAIESTSWILSVFGLGHRYLNKPSAILSYLSQAAYPIYIIHMFVLFIAAYLILPLDIHPSVQFVGICVLTFLLCFLIYEFIIRRITLLRPLFGLKAQLPLSFLKSKSKKAFTKALPILIMLSTSSFIFGSHNYKNIPIVTQQARLADYSVGVKWVWKHKEVTSEVEVCSYGRETKPLVNKDGALAMTIGKDTIPEVECS